MAPPRARREPAGVVTGALHRPRLVAAALAATLALASAGCSAGDPASDAQQTRRGLDAIAGVPQDGFTLGRGDAKWTLSVISSPTSYELDQLITLLPALSDGYVRNGRLKLQMRTPTRGPYGANGEERAAAGALLAAGLQRHYWQALVRFVANYDGKVTPAGLTQLLRQSGVPDLARAMTDRSSGLIRGALDRADAAAAAADGKGHLVFVLRSDAGAEINMTRQADKGRLTEMIGRELAKRN